MQPTWIIVGDELVRVFLASFPVGVLVLVPVCCLRIIPEVVFDLNTYENIREVLSLLPAEKCTKKISSFCPSPESIYLVD